MNLEIFIAFVRNEIQCWPESRHARACATDPCSCAYNRIEPKLNYAVSITDDDLTLDDLMTFLRDNIDDYDNDRHSDECSDQICICAISTIGDQLKKKITIDNRSPVLVMSDGLLSDMKIWFECEMGGLARNPDFKEGRYFGKKDRRDNKECQEEHRSPEYAKGYYYGYEGIDPISGNSEDRCN